MSLHFEEIEFLPSKKIHSFTNHTLITGKSGSGKSNLGEFMVTQKIGKQKVIDFFDDGRHENALYSLPETNPKLVDKMEEFSDGYLQPQNFPNQVIWFAGSRLKYYKKLPKNIEIKSLDQNELTLSDIFYLLGNSESAKALLGMLNYNYGDMSLAELMRTLESLNDREIHAQTKYSILRNIKRWLQSGLFSDDFEKINLKEILKDKKRITSFGSFLLENEDEKGLAYGLLLKKILDLKRRKLVRGKATLYIREISYFMGQYASPHMLFCRKGILNILREGRDLGLTLYADTQRAGDLKPTFRRQFGKVIQLKSDFSDAKTLLEIGEVPYPILKKIPRLNCGEGLIMTGSRYYYPVFFPPALHLHKKPNFNVLSILSKYFGTRNIILETRTNPLIRKKIPAVEKECEKNQKISPETEALLHG